MLEVDMNTEMEINGKVWRNLRKKYIIQHLNQSFRALFKFLIDTRSALA